MKRLRQLSYCALFALGLSTSTAISAEVVATHEVPLNHWKHAMMEDFAKKLAERTNGEIEFKVFPSAQLYSDADAVAALGTGGVHMTWPVSVHLETVDPNVGVLNLPFSLNYDQMVDPVFYKEVVDLTNSYLEPKGLKVLGYFRSSEGLLAFRNQAVTKLDEIKGMKVRVVGGKLFQDAVAAFGANPVSIPGPELVPAISQGVIDGAITSATGWRDMDSAAPHATLISGFSLILFAIVIDKAWFDDLSPELQQTMQDTVNEYVEAQWQSSRKVDEDLFEKRAADGAVLTRIEGDAVKEWSDKAAISNATFNDAHKEVAERYAKIVADYEARKKD